MSDAEVYTSDEDSDVGEDTGVAIPDDAELEIADGEGSPPHTHRAHTVHTRTHARADHAMRPPRCLEGVGRWAGGLAGGLDAARGAKDEPSSTHGP